MEKQFVHPYMPNSAPSNKNTMLEELGIQDVEELYGQSITEELRYRGTMNLPKPITGENKLKRHVMGILNKNISCGEYDCYLGAGCYNHYVPAICDEINSRAEFLTGYCGDTYSDHGKMQAIFEYTSMMGELLDMDVVSYTLYDGGQAVSSSLRMAVRIQEADGHEERNVLLVPETMNPEILAQAKQYCKYSGTIQVVPCDRKSGRMDLEALTAFLIKGDVAAVFLENPSYLGFFEEQAETIIRMAHDAKALAIVQPDVASLGVVEAPANYGADIVCGDIQPLGIHMQYGGGCAGFIATRYEEKYIQQFPTYLYGIVKTDNPDSYGWGRALNYRCSHGSREKANEYFGTETGLWSITAAVYLALMGPQGMYDLGAYVLQMCHYAVETLTSIPGIKVNFLGGKNFQEFVINFDDTGKSVEQINAKLLELGIFGGKDLSGDFPWLGQSSLYCVTEMTTCEQLDTLREALCEITRRV